MYEGERALRRQAEQIARRSLTDDEWALVAPDWSAPYGDLDVAEMVAAMRDLPPQSKPSAEEEARAHRKAHVERTALEAREMVDTAREDLFGHKEPPFPNRGIEGAEWIEAQVQELETKRFRIEVTVPAQLSPMESLVWLRDYLNGNLDDSLKVGEFLVESDAVREIGWRMPILAYLGVDGAGEINIKHVPAPDGTLLGRLQSKAEKLAKGANWQPYAAVHHLLTGGVVSPSAVQAKSQYRFGREVYGDTHLMTLEISDATIVTQRDLIKAFGQLRSNNAPLRRDRTQQRSKAASKSERVAALVEETPTMSWLDRLNEWNHRHPGERVRTISAMKQAYRRATLR